MTTDLKACSKCGASLPRTAEFFHRNSRSADGLRPDCIECAKKRRTAYYQTHADQMREKSQRWRANNRERHRAYSRQWVDDHPEQARETAHTWAQRNQDRTRENRRTHRAKLRTRQRIPEYNAGDYTTAEWRALCDFFGNVCLACGAGAPLTPDHVIPTVIGGVNTIDNIQPLCRTCNLRKHVDTTDYRDPVRLAAFLSRNGKDSPGYEH